MEDDDTKNVRFINGLWTIEQRGEVIYREDSSAADSSLGDWQERTYEGVLPAADTPGIRYTLTVRNREYSGDGTFVLAMTYLEAGNGKDETVTYTGSGSLNAVRPMTRMPWCGNWLPTMALFLISLCQKRVQVLLC